MTRCIQRKAEFFFSRFARASDALFPSHWANAEYRLGSGHSKIHSPRRLDKLSYTTQDRQLSIILKLSGIWLRWQRICMRSSIATNQCGAAGRYICLIHQ